MKVFKECLLILLQVYVNPQQWMSLYLLPLIYKICHLETFCKTLLVLVKFRTVTCPLHPSFPQRTLLVLIEDCRMIGFYVSETWVSEWLSCLAKDTGQDSLSSARFCTGAILESDVCFSWWCGCWLSRMCFYGAVTIGQGSIHIGYGHIAAGAFWIVFLRWSHRFWWPLLYSMLKEHSCVYIMLWGMRSTIGVWRMYNSWYRIYNKGVAPKEVNSFSWKVGPVRLITARQIIYVNLLLLIIFCT